MRVVALVSGGKDSCYNMMQCVVEGHEIVALANLHPRDRDELDSFMYQTVGHMGIEILAKAMALPLYRHETKGLSRQRGKQYIPTEDDEVEDLFSLLTLCKNELQIEAVAVGAILSDYQRIRVENVCGRLNLVSLAYLWRRDQTELIQEMINCQVYAIIIKVASLGLVPDRHLGKSLRDIHPHLLKMHEKYGLNVCGEGGEYETFTLDCPLFKQRIAIEDMQTVISSADPICPVGYINFTKLSLQSKEGCGGNQQQICDALVKKSLDYISDLNESTYSDFSDPDLSETELELIEKETRIRESLSQSELITRSNSLGRHLTVAGISASSSTSPIPIVTKSASVDEQTASSTLLSSSAAAALYATTSFQSGRRLGSSSTAAVCGSLSLAVSSIGISGGGGGGTGGYVSGPTTHQQTLPPSPIRIEREFRPLNNEPLVALSQRGWMWLAGIQGTSDSFEEGFCKAMGSLGLLISRHGYELADLCYVTLYIRSMTDYGVLNRMYGEVINFQNPPSRVCVECPLAVNCQVIIEAVAFKNLTPLSRRRNTALGLPQETTTGGEEIGTPSINNSSDSQNKRHVMHVQSISHWAPANIGPYSQSIKIHDITYISGQIALVPGSMTIIEGGIRPQCKLALRHLSRIAKAMHAYGQLRDVVHGICFVTHPHFIGEARRQWERRTNNAIMDYIVVPALPKEALVEWQVWAHAHNDRFEYEETGRSIGPYTISIRRRWNYENSCAAIVCYVSTGLATSTTQLTQPTEEILNSHTRSAQAMSAEDFREVLNYVINRLLKDYSPMRSNENLNTLNINSVSSLSSFVKPATATATATPSNEKTKVNGEKSSPSSLPGVGDEGLNDRSSSTQMLAPIPAINLKVFYQVTASPPSELLLETLNEHRQAAATLLTPANIVYTVTPVSGLHHFGTFLSICGVRHD